MLLGEILNGDDAEASNQERIALGLDLLSIVMSDITDNSSIRNETKILLCEECVEHGTTAHNFN